MEGTFSESELLDSGVLGSAGESNYVYFPLFRNPHIHTIYARFAREVVDFAVQNETIDLPDGDILEIGWVRNNRKKLIILVHGLEGRADAPYMRSTGKVFHSFGWDVLTWSFRGCGNQPNKQLRSYNSGYTGDLSHLIEMNKGYYEDIVLVGFSVGGNLCLKYLGEEPERVPANVKGAVAISSPIDLAQTADELKRGLNKMYLAYFLKSFKDKLTIKQQFYPDAFEPKFFKGIRDFEDYDNRFTAPWFNYRNAREYWADASCERFLDKIRKPTLFLTAQDDTFFRGANIPKGMARQNEYLRIEAVPRGGHVGFFKGLRARSSWMELRALSFLESVRKGAGNL
jgi:predicted alpha/beta-fold hydrolase